jgi:hypothetical protein
MNVLYCNACARIFNSQKRLPKLAGKCGHSICSECLEKVNYFHCPLCQNTINADDYVGLNYQIMIHLQQQEIRCSFHPQNSSSCLNLELGEAYCEECFQQDPSLVQAEDFSTVLDEELKTFENFHISMENKEKLMNLDILPNNEKFKIVKEIRSATLRINCDEHVLNEATFINIKTRKLLCETCRVNESQNLRKLKAPGLKEFLINKILWVKRAVNPCPSEMSHFSHSELKEWPLKDVLNSFKSLSEEQIKEFPVITKSICEKCQERFSGEREPFILNCSGSHILCKVCVNVGDTIFCEMDNNSFPTGSAEPIFSQVFNPFANCQSCKKPFDLKSRYPREFPCGHLLCVACLSTKHIDRNPVFSKCLYCQSEVQNIKSLPSSKLILDQIKHTLIYCSRHRNTSASYINRTTLTSHCNKCREIELDMMIETNDPSSPVYIFLLEYYEKNIENPTFQERIQLGIQEFKTLSLQGMLDKLRETIDPSLKGRLRSNIPEGKALLDYPRPEWQRNAFLFRFFSVMPCDNPPIDFLQITKPWVVLSHENHVEAVVFKANKDIRLQGIIFGTTVSSPTAHAHVNLVKVIKGKKLNNEIDVVYNNEVPFDFSHGLEFQMIHFQNMRGLNRNEYYSVIVRVRGEGVLLTRGNPFDIKEEFWGSDGTIFEFSEADDIGNYKINGQHDINGPFLGLVYEKL